METIAKKVVQNWAAKGYISDDEVEMCLYNLIRHAFTVAVLCVLTVAGALLYEWSNTIVLIVSILFLRTYTNGYHCKSCVACIFLSLAVTLLSLHIVPLLNFITALILMFVGSSIILAIAPTNSPQMHLTETEMAAMKKSITIGSVCIIILGGMLSAYHMKKSMEKSNAEFQIGKNLSEALNYYANSLYKGSSLTII